MNNKMLSRVSAVDAAELKNFGKRYLRVPELGDLCTSAGLYGCTEGELEDYATRGWLLPVARIVLPQGYAQAIRQAQFTDTGINIDDSFQELHQLMEKIHYPIRPSSLQNDDLRHPIDQAWGKVSELEKPTENQSVTWTDATTTVNIHGQNLQIPIIEVFYHHWQIYRLHWIRKIHQAMYQDNAPLTTLLTLQDSDWSLLQNTLDATSYFQLLYQEYQRLLFDSLPADDDNWAALDAAQQNSLKQRTQQYATDTLRQFALDEEAVYAGLKIAASIHRDYEISERYQLANALKADIGRIVELIHYRWDTPTDQISERIGRVGGYVRNYLEMLFPNRRREARKKATKILTSLLKQHNDQVPAYSISDQEIEDLLDYAEKSDLAWIEFVLAELNTAYFNRHSWSAAETFINLRLLASFPESLMKLLILNNADTTTQQDFQKQTKPGMGNLIDLIFRNIPFLSEYKKLLHWSAKDASEFSANLSYLAPMVQSASTVEEYLGVILALATLLRNFTSHITLDNEELFRGQYLRCLRVILAAAFITWKVAKNKAWV